MRAKRIILAGLLLVFVLVGCGSSGGETRHVVSIKTDNGVVSYGMTQEEAEKILGEGIEWQTRKNMFLYNEHGISAYYRDNSLCCIEATRTGLTLFNGVKIGDSKEVVKDGFDFLYMDSIKLFSAFFDESLTSVEVTPDIQNDYLYVVTLFFDLDVLEKVVLCDKQYAQQLR